MELWRARWSFVELDARTKSLVACSVILWSTSGFLRDIGVSMCFRGGALAASREFRGAWLSHKIIRDLFSNSRFHFRNARRRLSFNFALT